MYISGSTQPSLRSFVYEATDTAWEAIPDGVWTPGSINQLRNHWAEIQTDYFESIGSRYGLSR